MKSLKGIAELHMSGARAVFTVEEGATVGKEAVASAFEAEGMTLESFERVRRPRARAIYVIDAGVT